jgi:hypothetical protein
LIKTVQDKRPTTTQMELKKPLSEFTDEELVQEEKKRKQQSTASNFMIGLVVGVAVYSTVKNGFGFFTFFPLFLIPVFKYKGADYKEVQKEIELRKSNDDKIS